MRIESTHITSFSQNALDILTARYLKRDAAGNLCETPEGMLRRVAKAIASTETKYGGEQQASHWETTFYHAMTALDFLPNSPTLMNAGREKGQLSACFVLPLTDSLESIFTTLKNATLVHQSGGGTGFNFSPLRPKGDFLSSGGTSSGPVSFIRIFDAATEAVKQGGRRRGANMGILDVTHPDIEEFVLAKSNPHSLNNFNLSVWTSDAFMQAVETGTDWALINPRNQQVKRKIPAKKLWEGIVQQAWQSGDPGLLFANTIQRNNPTPELGKFRATNPCGEMPLLPYESCNLGSINLAHMVIKKKGENDINWNKLDKTVRLAVRFLDDVIDVNYYTLTEIREQTRLTRKIGLGIMGWAEMLLLLELPYASGAAVKLAKQIMQFIQEKSQQTSARLAVERSPFPGFQQSIYGSGKKLRNATRTSIAPTGTISILANTSASIEPLFALVYKRMGILDNQVQWEVSPLFRQAMQRRNLWSEKMKNEIYEAGSIIGIPQIPDELKALFQTSRDIPWTYHLQHQIAFQQHTDNAVSKTINLPNSATKKDVSDAFRMAWQYGAKGITIYRYGSKDHQVLQTGKTS